MTERNLDPTAKERKSDHIDLAFASHTDSKWIDGRFSYEPLLGKIESLPTIDFLGKQLQTPIWVSSMTGGTEKAYKINQNLARACHYFGMGMGLGSCRQLLYSDERKVDFDWRGIIGDDLPFFANLGIAQMEQLLQQKAVDKVDELVAKLRVDGLIIHVNPLQEWLQPEGDVLNQRPIDTIEEFLSQSNVPVIVKEVGQGMGKESLKALMKLPVQAIEFAAHGGTNFSKLELLRSDSVHQELYGILSQVGHSAEQMVEYVNQILEESPSEVQCRQYIISGGIKTFLDGHYCMERINGNAIYGQASSLLKHAAESYEALHNYIQSQIEGLKLAKAYLKVNKER